MLIGPGISIFKLNFMAQVSINSTMNKINFSLKKFQILIQILLINSILIGQNYNFEKKFGSSESLCHFIIKDTLWLGTTNCLMKILIQENQIIQIYSINNSPIDGKVNAIWVNNSNQVCIAIDGSKVALFNNNIWQTWLAEKISSNPLESINIKYISISEKGDIFCYDSHKHILYSFRNNQWNSVYKLKDSKDNFIRFIQHPNGNIWWLNNSSAGSFIIMMDSVTQIKLKAKTWDIVFNKDSTLYGIQADGSIVKIITNDTTLVVGTISNLFIENASIKVGKNDTIYVNINKDLYELKENTITKYYNDKLNDAYRKTDLFIDDNHGVWINYLFDNVICKFKDGIFSVVKYGLGEQENINSNSDKSILWFNERSFICSYNVKSGEVTHYDIPIGSDPYEFAESTDPNQMWLATFNGLMHFDGSKWNIKYDTLKPEPIYSLKKYSPTQLMGLFAKGSAYSLRLYDINKNTWTEFNNGNTPLTLARFYLDKTNRPWSYLSDSLTYFDNGKWNFLSSLNSNFPKGFCCLLAFDSKNKMYAASSKSVYSYDGVTWEQIDSNICYQPYDLYVDSRNWLWLVNDCPGLSYYDGKFWNYVTTANSNISNALNKLEEDSNGDMWISANPVLKYKIKLTNSNKVSPDIRQLIVFPNPAYKNVMIVCPENKGNISIYNIFGSEIWSSAILDRNLNVSLEKFVPGLYRIVYNNSINIILSKILIVE